MSSTIEFFAAITLAPSDVLKIRKNWSSSGLHGNPLRNVLVSPLSTSDVTLEMIRQMKQSGEIERVCFDSGGYQVQIGAIPYHTLHARLLDFYQENQWADYYVLPDNPPTSNDSRSTAWMKVEMTVNGSIRFFRELPRALRRKSLPVIQGVTMEQVEYCIRQYEGLDLPKYGFGSFSTAGTNASVNYLSTDSIQVLAYIQRLLAGQVSLHAFGVGTPPVVYFLDKLGASSFDSVGWMKTAGFGNVFLPLTRAYNVSYRNLGQTAISQNDFMYMKKVSGHDCPFCRDFRTLSESRWHRIMHNLVCVMETPSRLTATGLAAFLIEQYSPNYRRLMSALQGVK